MEQAQLVPWFWARWPIVDSPSQEAILLISNEEKK